jgi:hypothetical protein
MRIILYFIVFVCLIACGKNNTSTRTYIDQPNKSFRFDLSKDFTSYNNEGYQLIPETEILVGLNLKREEINSYDLEKEELLESIYYGGEKKNIHDVNNFFVISKDSILLNSPHSNTFFLIDGAGEMINRFELDLIIPADHKYKHFTLSSTAIFNEFNIPFHYDKSKNEVSVPFQYNNLYFLDKDIAYRYPPSALINLSEKQQIIRFIGQFPAAFQKESVPFQFAYTIDVSNSEKIINFSYSDQVFFESKNDFVSIRSKFDRQNFTLFKKGIDPTTEQQMNALNGDFMYLYTMIHPYDNSKLIRLCKHEQEIYKSDRGKLNKFLDAQWSLITYDVNTQTVINEYLLPRKVYDFKHLIPYKKGVLLVKSDDYKQPDDEEFLLLDYFKLF